jgi:hypothetical protein
MSTSTTGRVQWGQYPKQLLNNVQGTGGTLIWLSKLGQGGVTDEKVSLKTSVFLIQIHHMLMI